MVSRRGSVNCLQVSIEVAEMFPFVFEGSLYSKSLHEIIIIKKS